MKSKKKICIINPNTSVKMTEAIGNVAKKFISSHYEVTSTNPEFGPESIEGYYDEAFCIPGIISEIKNNKNCDAFVIACFDDTGLEASRSFTKKPVLGIGECSYHAANLLGGNFSVITTLSRSIPDANSSTHKGLWEKKKFKGNEIKGKTIGIIGFGFVGQRFAEMCFSLGLNVNICSNYFKSIKDQYINYNYLNLNDIIANSDFISFHCKPNIDNSSIINLNHMKSMKKNCLIIMQVNFCQIL